MWCVVGSWFALKRVSLFVDVCSCVLVLVVCCSSLLIVIRCLMCFVSCRLSFVVVTYCLKKKNKKKLICFLCVVC